MGRKVSKVQAYTQAKFVLRGKGGGRGFIYRGIKGKHKFNWNQATRQHELGPYSIPDFNKLKNEILESRFSQERPSVELCGGIEVDDNIVPRVEQLWPDPIPSVQPVSRVQLPPGINPLLCPDILTSEALQELQGKPRERDDRFDAAVVAVQEPVVQAAEAEEGPKPPSKQDLERIAQEELEEDLKKFDPLPKEELPQDSHKGKKKK